jgi:alpha-tubulin suppressor-like RCC1 family protein
VHIATDCGATCVAEQNGTVRCWGLGGFGVLGQPEEGQQLTAVAHSEVQDAVQIEAGKEHMCARLEDGRIQCWGRNQHGQLGNGRQQDEGELTTIDPNELEI